MKPANALKSVIAIATLMMGLGLSPAAAVGQPQFTTLHSFTDADGFGPMAGVVERNDGALYGTTSQGGHADFGTVFRLDRTTRILTTLHHFTGADGSTLYSGVVVGTNGLLYGSTNSGGLGDLGTLFHVATDGQNFLSLHSFSGGDGAHPDDLKLWQTNDGGLYGATSEGGPDGGGTLFRYDAPTRGVVTVHSFMPSGGGGVDAGLVKGQDGWWYGTTYTGGANGVGSVFRCDPVTYAVTTLHDFAGTDGQNPVPGALIQASDGMLYGTTQLGGYGKVYRLNPETLAFIILRSFAGTGGDGRYPLGGVVEGGDGYLYGTTVLGGAGYGTVYRVNPTTLAYNIVIWFAGSNGRSPSGNLLRGRDGAIYGVTRLGGANNAGTVYRLSFDPTPNCRGDASCDGRIDFADINPFVNALLNGAYCDGDGLNCDCNYDATVNFGDINAFVDILTKNTLPIFCP